MYSINVNNRQPLYTDNPFYCQWNAEGKCWIPALSEETAEVVSHGSEKFRLMPTMGEKSEHLQDLEYAVVSEVSPLHYPLNQTNQTAEELQLGVAELAEVSADSGTNIELALAELAEMVTGGVN